MSNVQEITSGQPQLLEPTISIVLPTLNEAANLPYVLSDIPADVHQLILVDGGSVDDTVAVAESLFPGVEIVQQTRRGKGNALACGFERCTGDIIVMIDADGSTDPKEIPDFVAALRAGAAFAKGTRFRFGGRSLDITVRRRLGNLMLNGVVNTLFRTRFSDLCYGYNAFWRSALPVLALPAIDLPAPQDGRKLWGDGFEIETLINIRVAREFRHRVREVPSVEKERIFGESNLNAVTDGLRVMRTIFSERFGTRRAVVSGSVAGSAASSQPARQRRLSPARSAWVSTSRGRAEADFGDGDVAIKRAS